MKTSTGLLPWLLLLTWLVPAAGAEEPSTQVMACAGIFSPDAERQRPMIVRAVSPPGGPAFDEIRLSISGQDSRGARLVRHPEGWKMRRKTDELRLVGKKKTRGPVEFRIHFERPVKVGKPRVDILLRNGRRVVAELPHQRLEQFPLLELRELLPLPPLLTPGETVALRPPDTCLTPAGGVWTVDGRPLEPDPDRPGVLLATLDPEQTSLDPLPVTYTNAHGEKLVDVGDVFDQPTVRIGPWPKDEGPSLTSCGQTLSEDSLTCICGFFPEDDLAATLRVDGEPAPPPVAVSRRSLCFHLDPGPHRIEPASGSPLAGGEPLAFEKLEMRVIKPPALLPRQKGTLRLEILGTTRPVEVLIRNSRPYVATLEGGPVQKRTTSGGMPNSLTLKVTGQNQGASDVKVQPLVSFSQGSVYRALLRRALLRDLQAVRTTFEARSRRLLASRNAAALAELAETTEQDLLHALRYRELEPLRDFVRWEFDAEIDPKVRSLVERAEREPAGTAIPASLHTVLAALVLANPGEKPLFSRIVDIIGEVIERLETSTESLVRDLTILSDPEGLLVHLHPKAYPSDYRELSTQGTLENLYIGRYVYRLSDPEKREPLVEGKALDLLHDTRGFLCIDKKGTANFFSEGEEDTCRKKK